MYVLDIDCVYVHDFFALRLAPFPVVLLPLKFYMAPITPMSNVLYPIPSFKIPRARIRVHRAPVIQTARYMYVRPKKEGRGGGGVVVVVNLYTYKHTDTLRLFCFYRDIFIERNVKAP